MLGDKNPVDLFYQPRRLENLDRQDLIVKRLSFIIEWDFNRKFLQLLCKHFIFIAYQADIRKARGAEWSLSGISRFIPVGKEK